MSKKYMSRPPYCFNDVPDYFRPPMTVEEYKACEAKYFDFLKSEEPEIEKPVGAFARLLRFIGMSKSTTLDGDDADVQESSSKSQGDEDKEKTVRVSPRTERREGADEVDHTTVTDMAEAEIDVNSNTASYRLREEEVHVVSSHDSDKEFNSCQLQLLEEVHENDKEKTVRVSPRTDSRERTDEVDHTTVTDMAEAEIDVNSNTASYRLREESAVPTTDVHAVSSHDSDKEFNSCQLQLLEEPRENGSINQDKEIPRKNFLKSVRKFFRRPFGRCLRAEE